MSFRLCSAILIWTFSSRLACPPLRPLPFYSSISVRPSNCPLSTVLHLVRYSSQHRQSLFTRTRIDCKRINPIKYNPMRLSGRNSRQTSNIFILTNTLHTRIFMIHDFFHDFFSTPSRKWARPHELHANIADAAMHQHHALRITNLTSSSIILPTIVGTVERFGTWHRPIQDRTRQDRTGRCH